MTGFSISQKIYYILRLAMAICFIGHGAFGIITKAIWCNYFAVFGIGRELAYRMMPLVGSFDIMLGLCMLVYPVRAIPVWLVLWSIFTALLRPLSGEPFAEFIERAGNFGAPLTLLILSGGLRKNIFTPIRTDVDPDAKTGRQVLFCLKIFAFLLIAGHGWLNILEKKSLLGHYAGLGFPYPARTALTIGIAEITAAVFIFVRPSRPMIFAIFVWKISSELFYPHYELFEWIERGGSYGILLALWFALNPSFQLNNHRVPSFNYS